MDAYLQITATNAETADKLVARARVLAEQAGLSCKPLMTLQNNDKSHLHVAAYALSHPPRDDKDYLSFPQCVLAYFDTPKARTRFNRIAEAKLTRKHRPLIERHLAEAGDQLPKAGAWTSDKPEERTAQLFILYINELVWRPLVAFMNAVNTTEMGQPEHLANFCAAFEAHLKRDGVWHKAIAERIRPTADSLCIA